jgi:hypothetical protein
VRIRRTNCRDRVPPVDAHVRLPLPIPGSMRAGASQTWIWMTTACVVNHGAKRLDNPIFKQMPVGVQFHGQYPCEFLECRQIQRVDSDKDRNVHREGRGDNITKAAAFGLVFTEFVDDQNVCAVRQAR